MYDAKEKFVEHLKNTIENNSFIKLTIGKYRGGDKEFQNAFVKKIDTTEGEKFSFTYKYKTRDVVKNYAKTETIKLLDGILGNDFLSATLFTTNKDFTIDYSKKRVPHLYSKNPSLNSSAAKEHNKEKSRFIKEDAKYLYLLGIANAEGRIKSDKYDKYKQVDKFIEIIDSLYRFSDLKDREQMEIYDMGSGKSYITFALYDYFANTLNKDVNVTGLEQREDLVTLSNKVAADCAYTNLRFQKGSIEEFKGKKSDMVVALHACDTATDDAIVKAIESEANIIVLAPCCHKYVRKKIHIPTHLQGIYKHGIMAERLAVMLTDGLRALMLEYFGYDTKVFEFISNEHTAKNTMITAVKNKNLDGRVLKKLEEIEMIKREFRIDDFYLDEKLELNLNV
jgi:hypothetical protein